jgi:large subunit ribosomal protein L17
MRHAVKGRKLGRTSSHREALFRNQLQSLMDYERIITTLPKAKELRPIAERVITRGKDDSVHSRRWALRWLLRRDLVKKLFDEISPRFRERPGGYLRIVKLGPRQGDGAEMAVIEMVDRVAPAEKSAADAKGAKGAKGKAAPKTPGKGKKAAADDAGAADGAADKPKKAAKAKAEKPAKPSKPSNADKKKAKAAGPAASAGSGKAKKEPRGKSDVRASNKPQPGGRKPTTPRKAV